MMVSDPDWATDSKMWSGPGRGPPAVLDHAHPCAHLSLRLLVGPFGCLRESSSLGLHGAVIRHQQHVSGANSGYWRCYQESFSLRSLLPLDGPCSYLPAISGSTIHALSLVLTLQTRATDPRSARALSSPLPSPNTTRTVPPGCRSSGPPERRPRLVCPGVGDVRRVRRGSEGYQAGPSRGWRELAGFSRRFKGPGCLHLDFALGAVAPGQLDPRPLNPRLET